MLERDGKRCQIGLQGVCTTVATVVHHTLGHKLTGNNPAHMVAACWECNSKIGEPDGSDAQPRRTTRW